jgi:hypothetical protein
MYQIQGVRDVCRVHFIDQYDFLLNACNCLSLTTTKKTNISNNQT